MAVPDVRTNLIKHLDAKLVDELLEAHSEAKQEFYLGGLRLNEVEGGRFCEAAFRLLEFITTGTYTQLGSQINTETLIRQLSQIPQTMHKDSIRLHIPRALRVVYDIRNNRDAAHLADGIDPNLQDAILVISIIDWVLAEFIRLYHTVSADEAQKIVENLVTRKAPTVQIFGDFLKVLNPNLGASDRVMVLLYQCGVDGASFKALEEWMKPSMRINLKRTITNLIDEKCFVHFDGTNYKITRAGQKEVENRKIY
ncbi:Uncharacterised protein [uncultured archaeon]|nr:Uncharacterised protein [uncultured archaeon]